MFSRKFLELKGINERSPTSGELKNFLKIIYSVFDSADSPVVPDTALRPQLSDIISVEDFKQSIFRWSPIPNSGIFILRWFFDQAQNEKSHPKATSGYNVKYDP